MTTTDAVTPPERPRAVCPDCGRDIVLHASGWWSHDGLPDGCWRLSMDGPNDPYADLEDDE